MQFLSQNQPQGWAIEGWQYVNEYIWSYYSRWGRGQCHLVYLPGGERHGVVVCGVAPPQALDESGCWDPPPDHVFLALLLLDLQRESGAQDTLKDTRFVMLFLNISLHWIGKAYWKQHRSLLKAAILYPNVIDKANLYGINVIFAFGCSYTKLLQENIS